MNNNLPTVYIARHGETEWSLNGRHTGRTDLPLTEQGRRNAVQLGIRLQGLQFAKVFTSPLQRAALTCQLAGFGDVAVTDPDLVEWNYGDYEGLRTAEILHLRQLHNLEHSQAGGPDWNLFRDGCPGGESPEQIGARADRVVKRLREVNGDVLVVSSGHFLRTLAACWLGLGPGAGRYFVLGTASLSALGYEHNLSQPAIKLWNEMWHVLAGR